MELETLQILCASNKDSDQPESLMGILGVAMQPKLLQADSTYYERSDCTDVQAGLSLQIMHTYFIGCCPAAHFIFRQPFSKNFIIMPGVHHE